MPYIINYIQYGFEFHSEDFKLMFYLKNFLSQNSEAGKGKTK